MSVIYDKPTLEVPTLEEYVLLTMSSIRETKESIGIYSKNK
jgi:hypothetical protein